MGAPLALLTAYAFSAYTKGNRIRADKQAEIEAEKATKKAENARGTLYKLRDDSFMVVPEGDSVALARAKLGEGKPLKYGNLKSLAYEIPTNNQVTDIYTDGLMEGPQSNFAADNLLALGPSPAWKVGSQRAGEPVAYDPEWRVNQRRNKALNKTTITPSNMIMVQANHPDLPNKSFKGDSTAVYAKLSELKISIDDPELVGFMFSENTDENGVVSQTNLKQYKFNARDDSSEKGQSDVRYTIKPEFVEKYDGLSTDNRQVLGSAGSVNPDHVEYTEAGKTIGDKFFPDSTDLTPLGTGTDQSSLAAALERSNFSYFIQDGNTIAGAKNSDSRPERLNTFLTQMTPLMAKNFQERYVNGDGKAVATLAAVYRDLEGEYTQVIESNGTVLAMYSADMSYKDFLEQKYGVAIQYFPALLDMAQAFDEDTAYKKKVKIVEDNSTDDMTATAANVKIPTPDALANQPGVPDKVNTTIANKYPSRFDNVIDGSIRPFLLRTITSPTGPDGQPIPVDEATEIVIGTFVNYKKDVFGRKLMQNGVPVPLDDQPVLEFFEELRINGIAGSNQTHLDFFLGTMLSPTASFVDQLNPTGQQIARVLAEYVNNDITAAVQLIAPLMKSGKAAERAFAEKYGFGNDLGLRKNFLDGQLAVQAASRRGLTIVQKALETYYVTNPDGTLEVGPDGQPILLDSTALGNLFLLMEGLEYLGGRALDFAGINFGNENEILSAGNQYIASARMRLKQAGTLVENTGALTDIQEELKKAANSKYAQREFFTLVLAYEVAAAIQGGTGGRTISDQDVALIFKGLRQRFSDSPEAQVNALLAVRDMLSEFDYRATMLTQDSKTRGAYMTAENLLFAAGIDIAPRYNTAAYGINRLDIPTDSPGNKPQDKFGGLSEAVFNERLLNRVNQGVSLVGTKYDTLDDVPASVLESQRRSFLTELQNQQNNI